MRGILTGLAALAASSFSALPAMAADRPPHIYGPAPDWARFRALAEAGVTGRLVDPESARITWLGGYAKSLWKPPLMPRVYGYVACGTVNARNRMGGYAGAVTFAAVVDFDRLLFVDLGSQGGDYIQESCLAALRKGVLPPVPDGDTAAAPPPPSALAAPSPAAAAALDANALGLSLQAMPEGAYVRSVAPGSPAAAAGVTPGMVITAVNGITLAGMGEAAGKVVAAAGNTATLTMVGGQSIRLGASR